jgi:hypothetical protein
MYIILKLFPSISGVKEKFLNIKIGLVSYSLETKFIVS